MHAFETQTIALGYIALAMLMGAFIGLDRELSDKPAGLRTHMLVAGAAALLVTLGEAAIAFFSANLADDLLRSDPMRIIEAVITGISFLGAGTIIRRRDETDVEGLTTAGSVLFAAAVGIAIALHQVWIGIGASLLVVAILWGIGRAEALLLPLRHMSQDED